MNTAVLAKKALIAAILVPMFATAGVVAVTDVSVAQQAAAPGGPNGGGGGRGGSGPSSGDGTSALDILCITRVCNPPRRPRRPAPEPVASVSTAPDCSCEFRTVRVNGQFVKIKDCYQIVRNTLRYCEPTAQ